MNHDHSIDHATLEEGAVESVRLFKATDARDLIVRSRLVPDTTMDNEGKRCRHYIVTITRIGGGPDKRYSLFSLGIQGRSWKVRIKRVRGNGVTFTRPRSQAAGGGVKTRGPFDDDSQPMRKQRIFRRVKCLKDKQLQPERIWFIEFLDRECELEIISYRMLRRDPNPPGGPQVQSGHDWAPPPPDGGGEDAGEGDGDDGEDESEEDGE